jgi:uncharacterized protein (TIGR00369 family)
MQALPQTRGCFVCGAYNPVGFKLELTENQQRVESQFQFKPEHCGFPEVVHGGLITTILDETMAWTVGVCAQKFAYCAELTVRFLRPIAPGTDMVARGEMIENKRGRLFLVRAEIVNLQGDLMAEASGKFLPLPEEGQRSMRAEFIQDPTPVLGPAAGKIL